MSKAQLKKLLAGMSKEETSPNGCTSTAKSPEEAKELFAKTEQFVKLRYEGYKKLSEGK
jgi:hypothetical protein